MSSNKSEKTVSWAVVSFFVIWPLEVGGHLVMYGSDGLGHAVRAAALGTALACVAKAPVYWLHEHAWATLAAAGGLGRLLGGQLCRSGRHRFDFLDVHAAMASTAGRPHRKRCRRCAVEREFGGRSHGG